MRVQCRRHALVNLKTVSAPQISPDGKLAVYVVTTAMPAGARRNVSCVDRGHGFANKSAPGRDECRSRRGSALVVGEDFYTGLRFTGREVHMSLYPREPHIFTEREHQADSLTRILDWYDAHLSQ